jgi:hypothetical protein
MPELFPITYMRFRTYERLAWTQGAGGTTAAGGPATGTVLFGSRCKSRRFSYRKDLEQLSFPRSDRGGRPADIDHDVDNVN